MSRINRLLLTTIAVLFLANTVSADKPLGYERYTSWKGSFGVQSGVFPESAPKNVYETWANKLVFFGPVSSPPHNTRLIDIEAHVTGKDSEQKLTLSGVWIDNINAFEQESWLQHDISWGELMDFAHHLEMEFIPLDIERYKLNGHLRYVVIWQRNIHKSHWYVKTDTSAEIIRSEEEDGFRVVDFDHYKLEDGEGFEWSSFDAIMVENTGGNYVNSEWSLISPGFLQIWGVPYQAYNFALPDDAQIVDFENPDWENAGMDFCYAVIVYGIDDTEVTLAGMQTYMDVQYQLQIKHGRIIDLEGGPSGYDPWIQAPPPPPYISGERKWHSLNRDYSVSW